MPLAAPSPRHRARLLLLAAPLMLALGCGDGRAPTQAAATGVATTFYPLTDFARRLVAPQVEVHSPLPPGEDPIFWQPDDAALAAFRGARLIVSNGAEFEKWLASASLPESRHVRTADGFRERFLTFATGVKHSHGAAGEHVHEGVDGHTWVDPLLAVEQVRALETALAAAFPEHGGAVHDRADVLVRDLETLHAGWSALAPRLRGAVLLASHPAYQYLAARHGLVFENFDLDPEALLEPDDVARARALVAGAAGRPVLMFWEGEPRADLVRALADELGVRSVLVTPAENPDEEPQGGYVGAQQQNLARVEAALVELGL
jgi:zinc transport system substrate-binding protein